MEAELVGSGRPRKTIGQLKSVSLPFYQLIAISVVSQSAVELLLYTKNICTPLHDFHFNFHFHFHFHFHLHLNFIRIYPLQFADSIQFQIQTLCKVKQLNIHTDDWIMKVESWKLNCKFALLKLSLLINVNFCSTLCQPFLRSAFHRSFKCFKMSLIWIEIHIFNYFQLFFTSIETIVNGATFICTRKLTPAPTPRGCQRRVITWPLKRFETKTGAKTGAKKNDFAQDRTGDVLRVKQMP